MKFPKAINVYEVGPRDGLQNESVNLSASIKVKLINKLSECGFSSVESTSFVSPRWVPQMSDNAQVMKLIKRYKNINYPVLVPNDKGLEEALKSNIDTICIFSTSSESFSKKNTNSTVDESLRNLEKISTKALKLGVRVRGYISCVLGCPYEGKISFKDTRRIAKSLFDMGCYEISLGDTVGFGTPIESREMVEEVAKDIPIDKLAAHFHDTYGQALANLYSVIQSGITTIDSSVGGLGGCPYAKGAKGNVATEDVLYMLSGMGIETGINIKKVIDTAWFIFKQLGREPSSRLAFTKKNN